MTRTWFQRSHTAVAVSLLALSATSTFFACVESDVPKAPEEDGGPGGPFTVPDSSTEDAGATTDAPVDRHVDTCSDGGFCTVPLPTLQPIMGMAATSIDDAWAVTASEILRWDGTSWAVVYNAPHGENLYNIAVPHRDDVWVLGRQLVIRYVSRGGAPAAFHEHRDVFDAHSWNASAFWVSPDESQFWVNVRGFDSPPALIRFRETGAGPDSGGTLVGDRMLTAEMGFPWLDDRESFEVTSVFGFASNDVYLGGLWCKSTATSDCGPQSDADRFGAIAHYDGAHWKIVATLDKFEPVSAIYGRSGPDDPRQLWVWAGRAGSEASSLRLLSSNPDGTFGPAVQNLPMATQQYSGCSKVHGSIVSPTTAWFSNGCLVYRWNGSALAQVRTALNGLPLGNVTGLWAGSAEDAWIVGNTPSRILDQSIGFTALRKRSP